MRRLAVVTAVLLTAAGLSALDRAGRRYLAGCAVFFVGAAALICGGISTVALVGGLVAAAGSLVMYRTARAAGA